MRVELIQIIPDTFMGYGHVGLAQVALKNGIDVTKLPDGVLVMFINRAQDKLKAIGKQGIVIGHVKLPYGQKIMMDALQYLPKTFGGSGFDYSEAVKLALEKRLGRSTPKRTVVSPLEAARAANITKRILAKTKKRREAAHKEA
jgi:hypothetical protein